MKAGMAMLGKNETAGSDNSASYNLQLNITALNSFEAKIKQNNMCPGIFPSTFPQPVIGSKNSILNCVMKLNLFMCSFFFFVSETPMNDFPFNSPILLTFWFRYLQTRIKESSMYLSSQLLFKTSHKTLKFHDKSKKNAFSSDLDT